MYLTYTNYHRSSVFPNSVSQKTPTAEAKTQTIKHFNFWLWSLDLLENGPPRDGVCCKVHSTACPHLTNGKSNYTQGSHVRAHMLEKCTPSSGRISSSRCWPPFCTQTHTHSIQPQGSVITGWDWAWNRVILFTCPELQLTDTHKHTGGSARMKLHRLLVQTRQLGTINLRHDVGK